MKKYIFKYLPSPKFQNDHENKNIIKKLINFENFSMKITLGNTPNIDCIDGD